VVSFILNAVQERCLYIEIGVGFIQTGTVIPRLTSDHAN
jgi:hypothetical protein